MTISDDDIDDFEFDDDFSEDWDDESDDIQVLDGHSDNDLSTEPTEDQKKASPSKKPSGSTNKKIGIIAPLSIAVFLTAGGYFGYTYYMPTTPYVPIVQIPSNVAPSAKIENAVLPAEQNIDTPKDVEISRPQESVSSNNTTDVVSITSDVADIADDVLTPLPDNFDDIDMPLVSLSEEVLKGDTEKSVNIDVEPSTVAERDSFDVSSNDRLFDEQEMIQKTESLPVEDSSINNNDDIFDRIDNISSTPQINNEGTENSLDSALDSIPDISDSSSESHENNANIVSNDDINSQRPETKNEKIDQNHTQDHLQEITTYATEDGSDVAAPVPAPKKPEPVKYTKANWKIKAIQPGKAVIHDTISGAVKSVEIGVFIHEIGKISDITKKNGKWVVIGKTGEITQ